MSRNVHRLKAIELPKLTKTEGMHCDGAGLYLSVKPAVGGKLAKSWVLRYMMAGRARSMGLGAYPEFPLAEARQRAQEARSKVARGVDPLAERDAQVASVRGAVTFKTAAAEYFRSHRAGWRSEVHAQQWESSLRDHVEPILGAMPVGAIDTDDVLRVLQPIWNEKTPTAVRVRGRIETVLDWAKVKGYRNGSENPARWKGHLEHSLPDPSKVHTVEHLASLPYRDLPGFMATLRMRDDIKARALEFAILVGGRTDEILSAPWSEFDLDAKLWTIPGRRMKNGNEHRVSLSDAAIALLQKLPRQGEFVFGALSRKALREVCNKIVSRKVATPHGFRSTFQDWVVEQTQFPWELGDMAISHTVGTETDRAYRRSDLFEKRRELLNAWAKFCKGEV